MTASDRTSPLVVPVVVDGWQMECCGHPPGVGDTVSWRLRWNPADRDLIDTGWSLTASTHPWDPGDDDPTFGTDATGRTVRHRVPVLATHGPLGVFAELDEPVPEHLELDGVLHEDRHVDTPHDLPTTTGTITAVHLVSFEHHLTPGENSRRWDIIAGTTHLNPVSRSPASLPYDPPTPGQRTGWRPGPSMILVDLAVT